MNKNSEPYMMYDNIKNIKLEYIKNAVEKITANWIFKIVTRRLINTTATRSSSSGAGASTHWKSFTNDDNINELRSELSLKENIIPNQNSEMTPEITYNVIKGLSESSTTDDNSFDFTNLDDDIN